ncbi:hypothetical protein V8E53_004715 [Lactarius tabidus]
MASSSTHTYIDVQPSFITERQPAIPPDIQTKIPAAPQFQTTTTTHPREEAPTGIPQTADHRDADASADAQWGENYGDPSGKLWMMYLTEAEKEDREIAERWKGDTDSILVFTGLFSGTVASFIIASYPNLSPDSSNTTNALLTQISQQLVSISSGTPLTSVAAQASQPFQPATSAVRVNALWTLSLILSLICALSATLVQQCARRYLRLTQRRGTPQKRARVRAYFFDGIEAFGLDRASETITTLLHTSVFLFLTGLVDFLLPINTTVAYVTLSCVTLFAAAYACLTILPNLYLNCPYRTPLSGLTWSLSRFPIYGTSRVILRIEGQFHGFLLTLWRLTHREVTGPLTPTKLRELLEDRVGKHRRWLLDGLGKSIELSATGAPPTVDARALEWTLTALDEDKEIEDFAARIPGFFDSHAVPDPASAILPLLSDDRMTFPLLGSRLYNLLNTCIPGNTPLTEEERKRRLRVCLKSLWFCGKAYNQQREEELLPSYFRVVFASPEMTHRIQMEQDLAPRVIGCCFGALVAKKLSTDINSRRVQVNDGVLVCLSAILGIESLEVASLLDQPGAIEFASIFSLMSVDADLLDGDALPSDVMDIFKQTLQILSKALLTGGHTNLPLPHVPRFHEMYSKAPKWLRYELQELSDGLSPVSSYARGDITGSSEPEPAHGPWTQQSHESQVRVEGAPVNGIGAGVL